jgi:hypothetical protein
MAAKHWPRALGVEVGERAALALMRENGVIGADGMTRVPSAQVRAQRISALADRARLVALQDAAWTGVLA